MLWRRYFEANAARAMPCVDDALAGVPEAWRATLVRSLARFQLGESGEGRIAHEIYAARIDGIDDDYRAALALFIREEGRHARILAALVRAMGGEILTATWTERAFRRVRRLAGVRTKLFVLLVAEIVGVGFYGAIAERLPRGALRDALVAMCDDEIAHLAFHRDFFATQARSAAARTALRSSIAIGTGAAFAIVAFDHASTLRALGISIPMLVAHARAAGAQRAPTTSPNTKWKNGPSADTVGSSNVRSFAVPSRVVHDETTGCAFQPARSPNNMPSNPRTLPPNGTT
jgi:hypothetical protein